MAATVSDEAGRDEQDEVRLALPAQPEFGRIARIAIAGLALRHGFGYSAVEDLRLAIDESLILLLGSTGHPGRIVVTYRMDERALHVDIRAEFTDDVHTWDEDGEHRFAMLVTELVDTIELDREAHQLTLSKSAASES